MPCNKEVNSLRVESLRRMPHRIFRLFIVLESRSQTARRFRSKLAIHKTTVFGVHCWRRRHIWPLLCTSSIWRSLSSRQRWLDGRVVLIGKRRILEDFTIALSGWRSVRSSRHTDFTSRELHVTAPVLRSQSTLASIWTQLRPGALRCFQLVRFG